MAVSNLKTVIESVLAPYLVAIEKYHAHTANSLMYDEVQNLIAEFDAAEERLAQMIADLRRETSGDSRSITERIDALEEQHNQDIANLTQKLTDFITKNLWTHDVVTLDGEKYLVRADTAEGIRQADEYVDPVTP